MNTVKSVIGVLVVFFIVLSLFGRGEANPADDCENTESAKTKAYIYSQFLVEEYLKSPSTADFPSYYQTGVSVRFLKACHFRVTAFVDSQNSFGGIVRNIYEVTVIAPPNDTERYRPEDLSFY